MQEECELTVHSTDGITSRCTILIPSVRRLVFKRLKSKDHEMEDDRGKPVQLQIIVFKRQVPATAYFFHRGHNQGLALRIASKVKPLSIKPSNGAKPSQGSS